MGVKNFRRRNLLRLLENFESKKEFGERTNTPPGYISQIVNNTREMGESVARRIETALSLEEGWMDLPHGEAELEPGPKLRPPKFIPVVGAAQLGDNGFWHELEYPVGHGDGYVEAQTGDPNAYALRVKGHSMHPAIRDGWFVVVEPAREPVSGEYVMVKLKDGRSMVKEFLWRRGDQVSVQSVNEDKRYTFDIKEIEKIHYVGPIVPPSKHRFEV